MRLSITLISRTPPLYNLIAALPLAAVDVLVSAPFVQIGIVRLHPALVRSCDDSLHIIAEAVRNRKKRACMAIDRDGWI